MTDTELDTELKILKARVREQERLLYNSEKRFEMLFEQSPYAIQVFSPDGTMMRVNRAWEELWNARAEDGVGKYNVLADAQARELGVSSYVEKALAGESLAVADLYYDPVISGFPGRGRWLRCRIYPVRNIDGTVESIVVANEDITDLKEAEQKLVGYRDRLAELVRQRTQELEDANALLAEKIEQGERAEHVLRESEERYRDLFESASDLIQIIEPTGKILYTNRSWRKTLGYDLEACAQLNVFHIIDKDCQDYCSRTFERVLTEDRIDGIETVFVTASGGKVMVEGNATRRREGEDVVSVRCIFRDVTRQKQNELELQRSQRIESIGLLAGGIAHDFNNFLVGILGNISLAKLDAQANPSLYEFLDQAETAAQRATGLTQQLLTFSKGGAPMKELASLDSLLREAVAFACHGSNVQCSYQISEDLWPTEVDKGQFGQVVHNLAVNAWQAMPDGGRIEVSGSNVEVNDGDAIPLPRGKYVKISLRDDGPGIKSTHLPRVFDPYFTTKPSGSGLGLATAYSIMKRHGGMMGVESIEGLGTVFYLYLPAAASLAPVKEVRVEEMVGGSGKILVMDDDEMVRSVAEKMLTHLGYDVVAVDDGARMIAEYKKAVDQNAPFLAVIMDLTIPGGMGGVEAAAKLKALFPDVRAIASSGYSNDPVMANPSFYGFSGVMPKPYTMESMSALIQELNNKG